MTSPCCGSPWSRIPGAADPWRTSQPHATRSRISRRPRQSEKRRNDGQEFLLLPELRHRSAWPTPPGLVDVVNASVLGERTPVRCIAESRSRKINDGWPTRHVNRLEL